MAKSTSRSIYLDQTSAEVALQKLILKAEQYEKAIVKGNKAGKDMTDKLQKLGDVKTKIDEVKNAIDKGLRPAFVQQEQLVRQLRNELRRLSEDAPGYAGKFKSFQQATTELNRMKVAMNGVQKAQASWLTSLKTITLGVIIGNTVQSALSSISGYISGLLSGNARLSDELASIEKASGLSSSKVKELNTELGKLDTRTKTSQLREIAIGLGQIGEAVTPENVAAIDKIVVALGDEFGGGAKEITTVLSILRNNLKDIKTSNYGDDVSKLGNAINVLGASGLATGPIITDYANRISGIGSVFKLTSGQILGTAATFQELGINVERGSTAFTKILQKITAEPLKFSQVAGLSIKEFTKLVNTDLLAAFVKVAEGAKIAGKDNVAFGKILKELDTDGSGAGEVLAKISQNAQLLSEKVNLASTALTNTNSITEEFTKRNTNLAAEIEKLGKRISAAFTNSTISNVLKDLVIGINNVITPAKNLTDLFEEQKKKVNQLEREIVPLIDRVDILKQQSKLSKEEQIELNNAIVTIGNTLPGAVTEFDKYGRAIGLSTEKAREFIEINQAISRELNRKVIEQREREVKEIEFQILQNTNQAKGVVELGERQAKQFSKSREEYLKFIELYNKQAAELGVKNLALEDRLKGLQGILKDLRGEPLVTPDVKKPPEEKKREPINFSSSNKKEKEDPRIKLLEDLAKLEEEIQLLGKSNDEKELIRIVNKYKKLIFEAQNYADIVIRLEAAKNKEVANLIEQITKKQQEEIKKQQEEEKKKTKTIQEENLKRREAEFKNAADRGQRDLLAGASLDILNAPDKKSRLEAEKRYLKLKYDLEIANQDLTKNEMLVKEKEYLDSIKKLNDDYLQEWLQKNIEKINEAFNNAQQLLSAIDTFNQARENKENAQLQKEIKKNDSKRDSYKRQLDQRLITDAEYFRKVQLLNEEDDRKKKDLQRKQFNRQKATQIAQAIISAAQAVVQSLANTTLPFPASLIGPVIIGASTIAQIALITSQKPPEFEKGGIARGGRHSQGGIDMVDRRSGRAVGNMEGGEPYMILSRNTYANNKDVIDDLLNSSMNRNGARIKRFWQERPYRAVNYTAASNALGMRRFEKGGIVKAEDRGIANETSQKQDDLMEGMLMALMKLNNRLNEPINAKSEITLKQITDAMAQDARIRDDSTMKA